jgi:small subunit ribosomal protein S21
MSANVGVVVRDHDIQSALKRLKKKVEREGVLRAARSHEAYAKPSERRRLKHRRAVKRGRKA